MSDPQFPAEVLRSDPEVRRTLVQQIAKVRHWLGRLANDVFDHFLLIACHDPAMAEALADTVVDLQSA